jgi:hypothetical protein
LPKGFGDLRLNPRMRLAAIAAARVERTAQRADRSGIGRARRHVLGIEGVLADTAGSAHRETSCASGLRAM